MKNLRALTIANNGLSEIDLYPLIHCTNLESLDLCDNEIKQLDITPLLLLPSLKDIELNQYGTYRLEALGNLQDLVLPDCFQRYRKDIQMLEPTPSNVSWFRAQVESLPEKQQNDNLRRMLESFSSDAPATDGATN
jgi:hypothetical protein